MDTAVLGGPVWHEAIVRLLLEHEDMEADSKDNRGMTLLP
jgi:hypothetical protein